MLSELNVEVGIAVEPMHATCDRLTHIDGLDKDIDLIVAFIRQRNSLLQLIVQQWAGTTNADRIPRCLNTRLLRWRSKAQSTLPGSDEVCRLGKA
jgi:hypothetical protein